MIGGEGDFHIGLHGTCRFQGITFKRELVLNRVKKFVINSLTGYDFYDDFPKFWKILEDCFSLIFLQQPKL